MTGCEQLSDRMVAVVGGTDRWAPADLEHLAACNDCGAEWRLVQVGAGLGAEMALDSAKIAAAVRGRLASPALPIGSARRVAAGRWLVGLAAAAAIVFALVRTKGPADRSDPTESVQAEILSELDDLTAPELESVLGELESGGVEDHVGGLGDLNANELEQILQSWES